MEQSSNSKISEQIDCGNCIVCQLKLLAVCDYCEICQNSFELTIEQNYEKLFLSTRININYNIIEMNSKVYLLKKLNPYYKKLEKNDLLPNRIIPDFISDDKEQYVYYIKISNEKLMGLQIRLENLRIHPIFSDEILTFIKKENNSNILALCEKLLIIPIEVGPEYIHSIQVGKFSKTLSINIIIRIKCSFENNLSSTKIISNLTSFILISILSNISTTLFMSMLYYKDILDAPHMIRKRFSPEIKEMVLLFDSFECRSGVTIMTDIDSFFMFQKFEKWFITAKNNPTYNINFKNNFVNNDSEYVKLISECRGVVLIGEIIVLVLSMTWICIFCIFYFSKVWFLKSKSWYVKAVKKSYNFLGFVVMSMYFNNWMFFLNELRFVKIKILGFYDLFHIFVRGLYVVFPLAFFYFKDQKYAKDLKRKKQTKKSSEFLNLLKNLFILFFVMLFNKNPQMWFLLSLLIQFAYISILFLELDIKVRENWPLLFQENFYLVFLFWSFDFVIKNSEDFSKPYIVVYFIGNSSSIFFIFFDIINRKCFYLKNMVITKNTINNLLKNIKSEKSKKKQSKKTSKKKDIIIFEKMVKKIQNKPKPQKTNRFSKSLKILGPNLANENKSLFFKLKGQ